MLGRIVFTWFQGTDLDNNAKSWRLAADIINDAAFFLEILSASVPDQFFLPLVCTGSVLKSIVGVAGGATRAALTQHQAIRNNMADVSAKDGSQEMAVGLCSMLLGIFLTPLIDTDTKTWTCFILFTLIHLFANYKAVRCVVLEKLNRQRASILIQNFLKSYDGQNGAVLSPSEVSKLEKTFYLDETKPYKIVLGASLGKILSKNGQTSSVEILNQFRKEFKNRHYILAKKSNQILIVLQANVSQQDMLRAYFHAQLYQHQEKIQKNKHLQNILGGDSRIHSLFDKFLEGLKGSGWNTEAVLLGPTEWRVEFQQEV